MPLVLRLSEGLGLARVALAALEAYRIQDETYLWFWQVADRFNVVSVWPNDEGRVVIGMVVRT